MFVLILILILGMQVARADAQSTEALPFESSIPLPDVKGRIDHFSVDVDGQRIFVAAVENGSVEIVDVKTRRRVHSIGNLPEPQGVLYERSSNRLFVACGGDGTVRIFDGTTFAAIASVKYPDDADNLRFDAHRKEAIVGYAGAKQLRKREEGTGGLGFFDTNGKKTADVVVDAHPESFQVEPGGAHIFVNVPEKKEIEVVDVPQRKVVGRWPVEAENNFPMALDAAHHRLLVGCWAPPRLLAYDTENGKVAASSEIAGKTDDLYYDSARSRVYVLTSVGFIDVFAERDADHYERIARYPTPPRSQTGIFVPEWSELFAAAPQQADHPAEIRIYRAH
ncbi:MAG TPA: hypothetical protein VND65_11600 [Candidatus Binatia bacterium]|nr:hypothetical protein [Candidatus Binatia bacterium]